MLKVKGPTQIGDDRVDVSFARLNGWPAQFADMASPGVFRLTVTASSEIDGQVGASS